MDNPCLHIIYDDRMFWRYEPLMKELEQSGVKNYHIVPATIDKKTVVENINASFKGIVEWAKSNNLPEVYIAEDDLMFSCKEGWRYYLDNKPEDFDLYIGGNYLVDNRNIYEPPLVKVNDYVGNHLICINQKYYDTFLSTPNNEHLDGAQKGKGDFYVCFPFPALQRPGKSANNEHRESDYNSVIPERFIYKFGCNFEAVKLTANSDERPILDDTRLDQW